MPSAWTIHIKSLEEQKAELYAKLESQQSLLQRAGEVLREIKPTVGELAESPGYGFMRTKNPHDYTPDDECCSPKEIENWKSACEAYDNGKEIPAGSWGIGTYVWRDQDMCKTRDNIAALLRDMTEGGEKT